jgi:major histocompatibility complex class I
MGLFFKMCFELGMVAHTFNPSTWEAEEGEFLSSRLAWSTE